MTTRTPVLEVHLCPCEGLGTSWHAELSPGAGDLGRLRVGPTAFAHRLGTWLGHPLAPAGQGERVAAAARILSTLDDGTQWFSGTRATDPVGAAVWMLGARDALRSADWDGGRVDGSARLGALSDLQAGVDGQALPPALVDELHALGEVLQERGPAGSVRVWLEGPRAAFAPVLQRVLALLEGHGVPVVDAPPMTPQAPESTDLGRLQRALLSGDRADLSGDGTVVILEGESPWEAAAGAAALLPDTGLWLLTAQEALLDRVRTRFDLPAFGVAEASRWRPPLQVLPLALALQTSPQDPQVALELLTLPGGPIPGWLSSRLVGALADQPAVGSPGWEEALAGALAWSKDRWPDTDVAGWEGLVRTLLPSEPPARAGASVAARVAEAVGEWARKRGGRAQDPLLLAAAGIAGDLARGLRLRGADELLDRRELAELHDVILGDGCAAAVETEAGAPPCLTEPAGVPAAVDQLTWFGLVEGAAEQARPVPWTTAERTALTAAGVSLPGPGTLRTNEQAGWLRAVLAPGERLSVVTWCASQGQVAEPHALLDLWSARLAPGALDRIRTSTREVLADPAATLTTGIPLGPAVSPRGTWTLAPGTVSTSRSWSASSIDALINCPLRWTFTYAAGLRPGSAASLPDARTLAGTFGHALFETLFFDPALPWPSLTPDLAAERMGTLFDLRLPTEAAPLALPAQQAFARRLRDQLGQAARVLVQALQAGGWRPEAAEQKVSELRGTFGGQSMSGSIDLVVRRSDGRAGIIDLKLGGGRYQRGNLRSGEALQLAVYAHALSGGVPPLPPVAYFILEEGALLTTDPDAFPGAEWVQGPGPGETMLDVQRAWAFQDAAVTGGVVVGRGRHLARDIDAEALSEAAGSDPPEHAWSDSKASCHFCDAASLCQFSLQGADR